MKISTGTSRKDVNWKVMDVSWEELCSRLSDTVRTKETVREYRDMPADVRSERKDVGGFVGGVIENGRRTKANVKSRSLVTLDADFAKPGVWETVSTLFDNAMCCYSTHSHTPKSPRLRFVIPLDREVSPEEYEPIARRVAADLGIDMFDVTTYETSRLMYWPSTPSDGEFVFETVSRPFLKADDVLARYRDWRDVSEWPVGSSETTVRTKQAKMQGAPREKPGLVGLFCRAHDIPSAIETYLSDVYEPCQDPNRYTYRGGSTSAGVVLYQDGQFAYSHHSTDPAGGILCNAFDLVRIHKFGDRDAKCDKDTPVNKLPSYEDMCSLVRQDRASLELAVEERLENAHSAFSEPVDETTDDEPPSARTFVVPKLEIGKRGEIEPTTENFVVILENDPNLAGCMAMNLFKGIPCVTSDLPWHTCRDLSNGDQWSDEDSAALTHYIETTYGIYNQGKLAAALSVVMGRHSFHPVQNYLNSLHWDGVERGEALFIQYLGASDTPYTRAVTRKWLTAAVARVMEPGVKFDNLVVLVGAQGIGKSYLGNLLGKEWFSDTFGTVQGKDAYEQLKGCWIIEIAELSAMKKAEVESVKMFISKREDNYRGAYREFAKVNKRQCVFYGTTNDDSFLRDKTGNRRFWPIGVDKSKAIYSVFDLTEDDIDQIWAEATCWYRQGEKLFLDENITAAAVAEQEKYSATDPRQGIVEEYLDRLVPENWETLSKKQRRDFIQGLNFSDSLVGTVQRDEISLQEMAYELFGEEVLPVWLAREYHVLVTSSGWRKTDRRKMTPFGRQPVYERLKK